MYDSVMIGYFAAGLYARHGDEVVHIVGILPNRTHADVRPAWASTTHGGTDFGDLRTVALADLVIAARPEREQTPAEIESGAQRYLDECEQDGDTPYI